MNTASALTVELPASYAGDYWGEVPAANNTAATNVMFEDLVRQLRTDKAFMDTVNGILAMGDIAGVPTGDNSHTDTHNSANDNRNSNGESRKGRLIRDVSLVRLAAQQQEIARQQQFSAELKKAKTLLTPEEMPGLMPETQNVIEYEHHIAIVDDERAQNPLQPLQGIFADVAMRLHGMEAADVAECELAKPMETPKVVVAFLVPKMVARQQMRVRPS